MHSPTTSAFPAHPADSQIAILLKRIESLEKTVASMKSSDKQTNNSLRPIKPPTQLKVMGKREQKKRTMLAELEILGL